MEQSTPRTMAARSWLLILCLAAVATAGVLQARAQPDSIGTLNLNTRSWCFFFFFSDVTCMRMRGLADSMAWGLWSRGDRSLFTTL
jgi:hypothetical protein